MKKTLMPFQQVGVDFLVARNHALLADEQGLGKTVQLIAAADRLTSRTNVVICPASVRLGWLQEIKECLGTTYGWTVLSYNNAVSEVHRARLPQAIDTLILDEAHFLKTPDSQRTQAIFGNGTGLARRAHRKWCATGTPVLNRPRELYPILKTLAAGRIAPYDNFTAYAYRYCGAFFDGRGLNTKGATRLDELRGRIGDFMLRRTKAEVMPELPPKIVTRVPLEVTSRDLNVVLAAEQEMGARERTLSTVYEDFSQLGDMATILRLTGEAKVRCAVQFILDALETEDKLVVFAHHRNVIAELQAQLAARNITAVTYVGGMTDAQKARAVELFKMPAGPRVFLGNIKAAGTGINGLQDVAASVVFAELSWVPGEMAQAMDRLHRIGQRAAAVNVYVLHAPGTLESAVLGAVDGKTRIIDRLLNDAPVERPIDYAAVAADFDGMEDL